VLVLLSPISLVVLQQVEFQVLLGVSVFVSGQFQSHESFCLCGRFCVLTFSSSIFCLNNSASSLAFVRYRFAGPSSCMVLFFSFLSAPTSEPSIEKENSSLKRIFIFVVGLWFIQRKRSFSFVFLAAAAPSVRLHLLVLNRFAATS
jgi:hypothetical protein